MSSEPPHPSEPQTSIGVFLRQLRLLHVVAASQAPPRGHMLLRLAEDIATFFCREAASGAMAAPSARAAQEFKSQVDAALLAPDERVWPSVCQAARHLEEAILVTSGHESTLRRCLCAAAH